MRAPRTRPDAAAPLALVVLLSLGALTACGGSGGTAPEVPASSASAGSTESSADRRIEVTVTGTTVTPAPAQVDLAVGERLELVVTSDHDDELHAHGFEQEAELKAGVPTTITLTGAQTGVFEVETHEPALTLMTVAVR